MVFRLLISRVDKLFLAVVGQHSPLQVGAIEILSEHPGDEIEVGIRALLKFEVVHLACVARYYAMRYT